MYYVRVYKENIVVHKRNKMNIVTKRNFSVVLISILIPSFDVFSLNSVYKKFFLCLLYNSEFLRKVCINILNSHRIIKKSNKKTSINEDNLLLKGKRMHK